MPPGVQRYKRTKMVLPLRVWPYDENGQNAGPQLAHTVDISPIGGRLGGLRNPLPIGQTIMIQRGQNRVQFRVVWTKQLGPGETRIVVQVELDAPAPPNPRRPAVSQVSAGRAQRRRSLVLNANRESVRLRIRELEREVARKKLRVDRRIEEGAGGLVIVPIREPQARAV